MLCLTLMLNMTDINFSVCMVNNFKQLSTVEPQLSEPSGRHTIRPDNRGVRIDEGNRNSPSVGYRVGDN